VEREQAVFGEREYGRRDDHLADGCDAKAGVARDGQITSEALHADAGREAQLAVDHHRERAAGYSLRTKPLVPGGRQRFEPRLVVALEPSERLGRGLV